MSDAPALIATWSRLWSPVAPSEVQRSAWQALDISLPHDSAAAEFTNVFHAGFPAPPVPLLVHAVLGMDGSNVREALVRVMVHLELNWGETTLPPDHVAVICDLLACALAEDERVLVHELLERYLLPWCEQAITRLADSPLQALPVLFREDLTDLLD